MAPNPRRQQPAPEHRIAFFQAFLRKPKEVGSIIPSSRFLMRRVVREARVDRARLVVELGPGTGGSTRALLRAMRPDARLLAIEINPRFARLMARSLPDPRLIVHVGSAEDIAGALRAHELPAPDVVLSGIPFSTMPYGLGLSVVRAVHQVLAPGGRFVAYQVRDRVEMLGRQVFGPARVQTELLNVPPMRVYRWEKPARFDA
jgi:phospholipid N-methyltransferase